MKLTAPVVLLFFCFLVLSQSVSAASFLKTLGKGTLYYVELNDSGGYVYEMGYYLHKAGRGFSIRNSKLLYGPIDSVYVGEGAVVVKREGKLFLSIANREKLLDTVQDILLMNRSLNNGYYLDNFFALDDTFKRTCPLYNFHDYHAFYYWDSLDNKDLSHHQFRKYADKILGHIKDSINLEQSRYVSIMKWVSDSIKTIKYNNLKDNLATLPSDYSSRYLETIVNKLCIYRPDYYFKIAQDLPGKRDYIFSVTTQDKEVIRKLKMVEGNDTIKKEFFKKRRNDRFMAFYVIGIYAVVIAGVILLIAQQ